MSRGSAVGPARRCGWQRVPLQAVMTSQLRSVTTAIEPSMAIACVVVPDGILTFRYLYRRDSMKRLMIFSSLLFSIVLVGCGSDLPPTVPVTGTVTLDGAPVEGASVTFLHAESNRVATGKTDSEGRFSLRTTIGEKTAEGAVAGSHRVGVVKATSTSGSEMPTDPEEIKKIMAQGPMRTDMPELKQTHHIPQKYNNPMMSDLTAEVAQSGANEVKLDLVSR
jgi:hypothetical protein